MGRPSLCENGNARLQVEGHKGHGASSTGDNLPNLSPPFAPFAYQSSLTYGLMTISGGIGRMNEDIPAVEHVAREFFYSVSDARLWENEPEASKEYFRQCARKAIAFQKQHGMGCNPVN